MSEDYYERVCSDEAKAYGLDATREPESMQAHTVGKALSHLERCDAEAIVH